MSDRIPKLQASLARRLGDDSVAVTPFREGVDAYVDLVTRSGHPRAVVKSAKYELRHTTYEGVVDFGDTLEKEVVVARLLEQADVPVPKVLAWHRTPDREREPSWLLSAFVAHEARTELPSAADVQLGRLARTIHRIEPNARDGELLAPSQPWDEWVVERILMRAAAARRYVRLPEIDRIGAALRRTITGRTAHARSLLHLDLRGPNLAVVEDDIVALFDYGNAIVGDPYFELAQLRHSLGLSVAFLEGYGLSDHDLQTHDMLLRAYGLDVTLLLVVVTREEFEDEPLHAEMVRRTLEAIECLVP